MLIKMKKYNISEIILWLIIIIAILSVIGYFSSESENSKGNQVISSRSIKPTCKYIGLPQREAIIVIVRNWRIKHNISDNNLYDSNVLNMYAQLRAEEMAQNNQLAHQTKFVDFFHWYDIQSSSIKNLDYNTKIVKCSENIASGSSNPCEIVNFWKDSPAHNAGLLNPEFNLIGAGYKNNYSVLILGKF